MESPTMVCGSGVMVSLRWAAIVGRTGERVLMPLFQSFFVPTLALIVAAGRRKTSVDIARGDGGAAAGGFPSRR